MAPLASLAIGSIIRWGITVIGAGTVATTDSAKNAETIAGLISSLPMSWQGGIGLFLTIAPLVWSFVQKQEWAKKEQEQKAPVEERVVGIG